jgi:Glycosyltransferase 61
MKYETLKNFLSSRLRLVRKLQLILFNLLRKAGLSEPLGLVRGVCYLNAPNTSAVICEGVEILKPRPAGGSGASREQSVGDSSQKFIKVNDGHCFVVSGHFEVAILDRKYRLISELSPDTYSPLEHRALRQIPLRREVEENLCILVTPGARANYYHWMVDLMPTFRKLKALDNYRLDHAAILLNHSEHSYQRECIDVLHLGVDVINARPYTLYSATHLFTRERPTIRGSMVRDFTPQDSQFLRSLFEVEGRKASIDFYVLRGDTRRRRIRNESEVVALMRKFGFEIFDPSGHSVKEQASQFARARKVIGFHGAGLTNTIFCNTGTKILEIVSSGYASDSYSKLASQLGLDYSRIVHDVTRDHRLTGIAEDFFVHIGKLEAELKCLI